MSAASIERVQAAQGIIHLIGSGLQIALIDIFSVCSPNEHRTL